MSKLINIQLRNGITIIKITKNGKTNIVSSSKARDLKVSNNGVFISPDPDETQLNNLEIKLTELEDTFGATTPTELLEAFADNGFFKKGGRVGTETSSDSGCFHLNGNTLKMCNLETIFNDKNLGSIETSERAIIFIKIPHLRISNIKGKISIGTTKINDFDEINMMDHYSYFSPRELNFNTTVLGIEDWANYMYLPAEFFEVDFATLSEVYNYGDIFPFNFPDKLEGYDNNDSPEYLLQNLDNIYPSGFEVENPIKIKFGRLNGTEEGIFLFLPKDSITTIIGSAFACLSDLEITFSDITDLDLNLYKNNTYLRFYNESDVDTLETYETKDLAYSFGG